VAAMTATMPKKVNRREGSFKRVKGRALVKQIGREEPPRPP
jgi:hypothetical protein